MKIGFDAKRLFHNKTGLGNYSRTLVQNLYRYHQENEYFLYAPKPIPEHPFFNTNHFSIYNNDLLPSYFWRSWQLPELWKKQGVQVYHGLSNELPFSKSTSTKTIVTIHDLIFKRLPTTYPFIDRLIYDKKVKSSCNSADCIIAISEQTKKDLCELYKVPSSRIKVVYQSVSDIFYTSTTPQNSMNLPKNYFLCVGTLEPRKNQLQILRAWQGLKKSLQLPIVLVGNGKEYRKKIQKYAVDNAIDVRFLDNVHSVNILKSIYQNATLFIYPSLYEGFGLPVVEAALCKTPIITTANSAMEEAIGSNALLINPNDLLALTAAITSALVDTTLREDMVAKGYQYAMKKFNAKALTEQLVEIYFES